MNVIHKSLVALFLFVFWYLFLGQSPGAIVFAVLASLLAIAMMNRKNEFDEEQYKAMQSPDMRGHLPQTKEAEEGLQAEAYAGQTEIITGYPCCKNFYRETDAHVGTASVGTNDLQ